MRYSAKSRATLSAMAQFGKCSRHRDSLYAASYVRSFRLHDLKVRASGFQLVMGTLRLATSSRESAAHYALKVMRKQVEDAKQGDAVVNERSILLKHSKDMGMCTPNFLASFSDDVNLYVLFDSGVTIDFCTYMKGNVSADKLEFTLFSLVSAICSMHNAGIVHRWIVPEAIMVDQDGYLQIVDYRFAKCMDFDSTFTICGTPEYMAPEQANGSGHSFPADWWSLGIFLYELSKGSTPFGGEGKSEMDVYKALADFDGELNFAGVDKSIADLISRLLVRNAQKRLSAEAGDYDIRRYKRFEGAEHTMAQMVAGTFVSPFRSEAQEAMAKTKSGDSFLTEDDLKSSAAYDGPLAALFAGWDTSS